MIGGYIYRERDEQLDARLQSQLDRSCTRIQAWDRGCLFHDEPYPGDPTSVLVSDRLMALSQDVLVTSGPDEEYRRFDLQTDLPERFATSDPAAFDSIASDYRMAVVRRAGSETRLYLVSQRAGAGRIYYHTSRTGLIFSSDLRFLLRVVVCDVNFLGIYAVLRYGAIPEPMTISTRVNAVRPAHCLEYEIGTGQQKQVPYFRLQFECDAAGVEDRSEGELLPPVEVALRKSARFLGSRTPAIMLSGGIDSSLYGCYLSEAVDDPPRGLYCVFGDDDPELQFARQIADRIGSDLYIARMGATDALDVLGDVTRWTDHPFSDFSSLPITFLLRNARERLGAGAAIVECNGGDDCFGFPDLESERKSALKHHVPRMLKRAIALALRPSAYWKWESREGVLARLCAVSDSHEENPLNYFLVLTPVGYLRLDVPRAWDDALGAVMDHGFASGGEDHEALSYRAKTTIRQLLQVNSRRWAAKALSVGESLGLRIVYPYIWRDVLMEQGRIPWSAKIKDGVVKWPLKRLLEARMPTSFIYRKKSGFVPPFAAWLMEKEFNGRVREAVLARDAVVTRVVPARVLERLLDDALRGRKLRHSILNFLWGTLFTEMWIREHGR